MNKLLVICGPTATGKTKLALKLAKKFNGELISADSRQVYRGMDIGTGKDLPKSATWNLSELPMANSKLPIGYYKIDDVSLWGYDLIKPEDEFSVSLFANIANKIIKDIYKRKKLPIIDGGTGLYINSVVNGIDTILVPQDNRLRKILEKQPAKELFERLAVVDPVKAASLNESDKNNPRRLVRAIEIAQFRARNATKPKIYNYDPLFIGLSAKKEVLTKKIEDKVDKRIDGGFEEEVSKLLASGFNFDMQSSSSLGYRQWRGFVEGKISRREAIDNWKKEETRYAKRQLTWFKKDKRIKWFDVSEVDYVKKVEKTVGKWYKFTNR